MSLEGLTQSSLARGSEESAEPHTEDAVTEPIWGPLACSKPNLLMKVQHLLQDIQQGIQVAGT